MLRNFIANVNGPNENNVLKHHQQLWGGRGSLGPTSIKSTVNEDYLQPQMSHRRVQTHLTLASSLRIWSHWMKCLNPIAIRASLRREAARARSLPRSSTSSAHVVKRAPAMHCTSLLNFKKKHASIIPILMQLPYSYSKMELAQLDNIFKIIHCHIAGMCLDFEGLIIW